MHKIQWCLHRRNTLDVLETYEWKLVHLHNLELQTYWHLSHQLPFQEYWSISIIHKLSDAMPYNVYRQFVIT